MGFLSYLTYSVLGIVVLANNNEIINQMWFYNLISLLAVPLFLLTHMYGCFINYKYYLFILLIILIWGGIIIFDNINNSNIWNFSLVTFLCQILVVLSPIFIKLYIFICSLKTPCCCIKDDYLINKKDNDQQKVNTEDV